MSKACDGCSIPPTRPRLALLTERLKLAEDVATQPSTRRSAEGLREGRQARSRRASGTCSSCARTSRAARPRRRTSTSTSVITRRRLRGCRPTDSRGGGCGGDRASRRLRRGNSPCTRPIEGVPTSITTFVGRTWRGPLDEPVHLGSFGDYERQFGGLWRESTLGFAVKQFFENGGTQAIIVRVATRAGASAAKTAVIRLQDGEVLRARIPEAGASIPRSRDRSCGCDGRQALQSHRDGRCGKPAQFR